MPTALENANPFGSLEELLNEVRLWLAPLELTLIFEYLYARLSVRTSKEVLDHGGDRTLSGIVDFVRYNLLLIATSEMHHLRWANELLWKLCKANDLRFTPVLEVSQLVPKNPIAPTTADLTAEAIRNYVRIEHKIEFHPAQLDAPTQAALAKFRADTPAVEPGFRERALRPLTKDVIGDFIALEHPSSFIDGAYARVIATLRQPNYPGDLVDVATRIASEGMEHERHFIDINSALAPFDEFGISAAEHAGRDQSRRRSRAATARQDHRQLGQGLRRGRSKQARDEQPRYLRRTHCHERVAGYRRESWQ